MTTNHTPTPWIITDNNRHSLGRFSSKEKAMSFVKRQIDFEPTAMWLEKFIGGEYIKIEKVA